MKIKLGYLGPGKGTFGYAAALKFVEQNKTLLAHKEIDFIPFSNHASITVAVGKMEIDFGVLAVENSTDGIISHTVRSMEEVKSQFGVSIFSEVLLPIRLYPFMQKNDGSLPTKIVSHQSPLQQAGVYVNFMREQGVLVEQTDSTDVAAQMAVDEKSVCAIGAQTLGQIYNLDQVSSESIEDQNCNETRFWIISKSYNPKNVSNSKTAFLCFLQKDIPGGLTRTFQSFSEANPPITIAIMYPIPLPNRNWEYAFLLEAHGYVSDDNMMDAWQKLRNSNFYLSPPLCLGSYPAETTELRI